MIDIVRPAEPPSKKLSINSLEPGEWALGATASDAKCVYHKISSDQVVVFYAVGGSVQVVTLPISIKNYNYRVDEILPKGTKVTLTVV